MNDKCKGISTEFNSHSHGLHILHNSQLITHLKFLPHAGNRNIELFPVFGDSPSRNFIALII